MAKSNGQANGKGRVKKAGGKPRKPTSQKPSISAGNNSIIIDGNVENATIQISSKVEIPVPRMAPPFPQLLLGRDELLSMLTATLYEEQSSTIKVLALVGMGGIGKTTLAAALANQPEIESHFPDGTVWISLGPKPDVMNIFLELGMQFGKDYSNYPSPEARSRAFATLLHNKKAFIVLDDVWSIEDAKLFMTGDAGCILLVTTRNGDIARSLALKNVFQVGFLSDEESLELLKSYIPNESLLDIKGVQRLFSVLGGLPLALTLAGKIISDELVVTNSVSKILAELKEKERILGMTLEQESKSLNAVIGVSYERLPDDLSRRVFRSLGIFGGKPNTFSVDAAAAICGLDVRSVQKALVVLVNRMLVNTLNDGRYSLHTILAEYALNLLGEEETPGLYRKHADYFLEIAQRYRNDNVQDWHIFDVDWGNFSLSLNWLSSNPAGDLDELTSNYVRAFSDVIQIRRPSEGLKWLKAAELSSQRIGNFQLEANLALTQGALNLDRGEFDLAIEDFERSEKLFEAIGIMDGMYYARGNLGLVQHRRGNYPQAKHIYQQVIEMCESYQDRMGVAIGYLNLGDVHYCLKNYPEALLNLGESVKLFREEAARDFLVRALALMSKVQMSSNLPSQARESGEEAYRIAGLISSPGLLGLACQQMGDISASDGEMDVAEIYFQKAIRLLTESNFQDELAEACIAYGKFLLDTGKSAASKQYFLEAAGIFEYMGAKFRMQEVDELLRNLQDI